MMEPATAVAFPSGTSPPELIWVRQADAHDRLSRSGKRLHCCVLRRIRRGLQPNVGEHPVVAVDVGGAQGLAVDRNQALAILARGFCQQLFQPGTEVLDAGEVMA